MKISIDQVEFTLQQNNVDPKQIQTIINDLKVSAEEEKGDKTSSEKEKYETLVFVNDPEKKLSEELTAWVVQYAESVDTNLVLDKIRTAVGEFNANSNKKKSEITGLGEAFQVLKPRNLKDKKIKVKTKEQVRVIPIDGSKL